MDESKPNQRIISDEMRQKTNEYYKTLVQCECGITIMRGNIYNHKKSKKHFNLMLNKETPNNFKEILNYVKKLEEKIDHFKLLEEKIDLIYGKLSFSNDLIKNKPQLVHSS